MSMPLELAVIRVFNQSQRVIGAGFLVDETRALTCAHVIRNALNISGEIGVSSQLTVKIDFPLLQQQKTCFARIAFLDQKIDMAGIELTSDPPIGAQPVRLVTPEGDLWGHPFRAIGFSRPEGIWATGVLRSINQEGWIQIEDTKSTGCSIQPGFSGAPVWDENLQAVVGMIVAADRDPDLKVAFCIPCKLFSCWEAIRNKINPAQKKEHVFLSYKQKIQPDQLVKEYLERELTNRGYSVFSDATIRTGEKWLDRIDEELARSDFLVVLLSDTSADSEMVQSEIQRAYEYRKKNGHPQVLPVRVAYEDLLPYSISAFLNPFQYIIWKSEADNERVMGELVEAMQGQLPTKEPVEKPDTVLKGEVTKPVPMYDAGILDELQMPGGTLRLQDKFYIMRNEDFILQKEMKQPGAMVTIRAARQTGKSSLLVRGIDQAKQSGANTLLLDMQRVDKNHLLSLDVFLRYFAEYVFFKMEWDTSIIDHYWQSSLGSLEKLTILMEDHVFEKLSGNLVIGMDEIDRLLETSFFIEFFGLLRSWYNLRASESMWNKLSILMVISTEPYLLIPDVNQSPFNVGTDLFLKDFNTEQIGDLNKRHRSPVAGQELVELESIFGGHPYLTRKALYLLVADKQSWDGLKKAAVDEHGPFGDHLRRCHWLIRQDPALKEALRCVIKNNKCSDDMLYRLLKAGLVKASGNFVKCRCDLYRLYFEEKL